MGTCLTLLDITETSSSTSRVGELQETHRVLFVGTVLVGEGGPADERTLENWHFRSAATG